MRLHGHLQQQIPRRCSARAGQPLPAEAHSGAVGKPLRNRHADRFRLAVAFHTHVGFAPLNRKLEGHLNPGCDILARLLGRPAAATGLGTPPAKQIAKSTRAAKQALQIDLGAAPTKPTAGKRSAAGIKPGARSGPTGAHALKGVTVAVVHLPLARVVEHVEGGLHLLEFFLGRLVVGMQIGVILPGEFAIRLANIFGGSRARHAEGLVVVFRHRACTIRLC